jgi:hypothetical protein
VATDTSPRFDPALRLADLSRAELAVLGREWMLHGHLQDRLGMPMVHAGRPIGDMAAVAIDEWMAASPVYTRRMQRALSFEGDDVATIFKGIQLDIGAPHHFLDFRCVVKDPNHGEFHLAHCGALMDVEPMGIEYVHTMCHDIEDPTFDATAVATNPRARVRPVHRPPREPADRTPHCHWTVTIDPANDPIQAHPNVAAVERSLAARLDLAEPATVTEPGGWDDYSGEFDPDFALEDLSQRALVVTLDELALQSHLLMRAFLLTVAQRYGDDEAERMRMPMFTGLGGLTAHRLRAAMAIDGEDSTAIARVLQLHPLFHPRAYVDLRVEVEDDATVRFAIGACPVLEEVDRWTWHADLDAPRHGGLDAIVRAVNPRASVVSVAPRAGERHAWYAVVDPTADPAPEAPEVGLARISTGASFAFTPRRPVRT